MERLERLESEADIFGALFFLAQHAARRADAAMEPVDLTTKQWLLLAILVKTFPNTAPTLSEAARWYGSSRQNVKQIALQLSDRGYLQLVEDAKDRRALRLRLTDKVARLDEPAERQRQAALFTALFEGLEEIEITQLRALTAKWLARLSPDTNGTRSDS